MDNITKKDKKKYSLITFRQNEKEIELFKQAERILGTNKIGGDKSQTIKRCIEFTVTNHDKPVRDFKYRYGEEEKRRIFDAHDRGDV